MLIEWQPKERNVPRINRCKAETRKAPGSTALVSVILFVCSFAIALVGGVSAYPGPRPQGGNKFAAQMPDGDGKKIIVAKCQLCHTLERVVTANRGKDDWQAVIDLMVAQGAALSDDETKTVVDYLSANFGPKAAGSTSSAGSSSTQAVDPDKAQFTAPPDSLGLPKGVQMSVVAGDPMKAGLFSALFKLPADQTVQPHWQSVDVDIAVLRGTYEFGSGDAFDAAKLSTLNAGEVLHIPAQSHQFGRAKGEAVLLVYGVGPLSINWATAGGQ
jgi:hypothetical protein